MNKIIQILMLSVVLTLLSNPAIARWTGPIEIMHGTWGAGVSEFGLAEIEMGVFGPQEFDVDKDGVIVIADSVNNRIVIYNQDGTIKATHYKPVALPDTDNKHGWPVSFVLYPGGGSYVCDCEFGNSPPKKCFIDYNNNVVEKVGGDAAGAEVLPTHAGFIMFNYQSKKYLSYSPTGQLIQTYTERPLELGQGAVVAKGDDLYKITIKYPEKTWAIVSKYRSWLGSFVRDSQGRVYHVRETIIQRFDDCGKEMASLSMPAKIERTDIVKERPFYQRAEDIREGEFFTYEKTTIIEEYGFPVLAPNGDVYTWKRTPEKYSILKWTWVDEPGGDVGPDAPTGLTVTPSTNGLYLAWKPSPQDPGCVTGYEISRSTSAGGVYTVVATVEKGIVNFNDTTAQEGTTYFYKIRAKSGNDFSPYTPEASAKR